MNIAKESIAGTLESNDLLVKVSPSLDASLEVHVISEVMYQFGAQIEATVHDELDRLGVKSGVVIIEDKGALDCTIRARVEAAILRSSGAEIDWSRLS
jgi:citrate lyase subunit gamma (acyl carrier protein)